MPGAIANPGGAAGPAAFSSISGDPASNAALVSFVGEKVSEAIEELPASGPSAPVRGAHTAAIDLSRTNGTATPATPGTRTLISAPYTPIVGARTDFGVAFGAYALAADIDLSNFTQVGPNPVAGNNVSIIFLDTGAAKPFATVTPEGSIDITKPIVGNPAVANASPGRIVWDITELNTPSLNGVAGGITLSGANAAGKTVNAVSVVGNQLFADFTPVLAYGQSISAAVAAGMVRDAANNLSNAVGATAVTNNIVLPLPGAPVIAAGTNTSTTVNGTVAAGPGVIPANYRIFYAPTSTGVYVAGDTIAYAGVSTPFSITGLSSGTSYDVVLSALNDAGESAASNIVTSSTTAPSSTITQTNFGYPLYTSEDVNLTAVDPIDFFVWRAGASKAGAGRIVQYSETNNNGFNPTGGRPVARADANYWINNSLKVQTGPMESGETNRILAADPNLPTSTNYSFPVPAGIARKFRVFYQMDRGSGTLATAHVICSLADNSVTPLDVVVTDTRGNNWWGVGWVEFTITSDASTVATVKVQCEVADRQPGGGWVGSPFGYLIAA